jgi:hypothetical protein
MCLEKNPEMGSCKFGHDALNSVEITTYLVAEQLSSLVNSSKCDDVL